MMSVQHHEVQIQTLGIRRWWELREISRDARMCGLTQQLSKRNDLHSKQYSYLEAKRSVSLPHPQCVLSMSW